MNFLLHFIFIATFLSIFVVSIILLKPFRKHRKRNASTIALKISYLLYLFVFLLLSYLVLFYSRVREEMEDPGVNNSYVIYYIAVIVSFFVPNLGIMLRRKIKKFRNEYNLIFTGINILVILVLLFILYTIPWEF